MKTSNIDINKIRETAENYYRNGDFFCSEAIVKTIKDEFELPVSDEIVAAASGFPIGIGGSGCTCGAVSGGVMALGLVFGRQEAKDPKVRKTMELTKELHEKFRKNHKSLCCRILTKGLDMGSGEHKEQCISFTGEVAEEVAKIIVRELNNNNLLNHVGV
ncbi:C-GCAxxG-C-C family protein [Clostridium saudiense]|nr:C-GCAxxG-C-C family protein [Clostridium saudiense]